MGRDPRRRRGRAGGVRFAPERAPRPGPGVQPAHLSLRVARAERRRVPRAHRARRGVQHAPLRRRRGPDGGHAQEDRRHCARAPERENPRRVHRLSVHRVRRLGARREGDDDRTRPRDDGDVPREPSVPGAVHRRDPPAVRRRRGGGQDAPGRVVRQDRARPADVRARGATLRRRVLRRTSPGAQDQGDDVSLRRRPGVEERGERRQGRGREAEARGLCGRGHRLRRARNRRGKDGEGQAHQVQQGREKAPRRVRGGRRTRGFGRRTGRGEEGAREGAGGGEGGGDGARRDGARRGRGRRGDARGDPRRGRDEGDDATLKNEFF